MEKRKLGNTNLHVAPIAFGGNVLGWTANEKMSFDILDAFTTAGFSLIDTADVYSRWGGVVGGESETIIGKWHKKHNNRDKIIIASKGGLDMDKQRAFVTKKYLLKTCEDSLKRLQTDYIDLYQTHRDAEDTPVEEALEAYAQLIKEGKIRFIGASNFSAARFEEALKASEKNGLPRYETMQPEYNLCEREVYEKEMEPLCVKNNISVLNYFALGAGFLTGKYRSEADLSKSVRRSRVEKYLNPKGFQILKALDEVAAQQKSTCGSIAIAWLLHRPSVTAPIASATNLQQLDSLIKSVDIKLSKEQIALLDEASK